MARTYHREIRHFFKGVQARCYDTAQRRLSQQLPAIISLIERDAREYQSQLEFSDMTGNWINSFGVVLYRDGRAVAVADMSSEVGSPIRTTLIDGDRFAKGKVRFDDSVQEHTFYVDGDTVKGSSGRYFSDERVLGWLRRTWTKRTGFSFRVVSVAEYQKEAAKRVLLRISDELESRGGNIWQFNLG